VGQYSLEVTAKAPQSRAEHDAAEHRDYRGRKRKMYSSTDLLFIKNEMCGL